MMKKPKYAFDFNRKSYMIALWISSAALAVPALAQLPALPPLPGSISAPAAPQAPQAPMPSNTGVDGAGSVPQANASMPGANLPPPIAESSDKPVNIAALSTTEPSKTANDLPPSLPLLNGESSTGATAIKGQPMPNLPMLAPTSMTMMPPPSLSLPLPPIGSAAIGSPAAALGAATALPAVTVESEKPKPKPKSWETRLAPSIVPPKTSFNYRRILMPSAIYQPDYAEQNKHLPKAVTRQDYDNLLFASASRNDVEAVRALLNAGANINALGTTGETPLATARRSNAASTAQLLVARGGR